MLKVVTLLIAPAVEMSTPAEATSNVPLPALMLTLSPPSPSVAFPFALNAPVDVSAPENVASPAAVIVKRSTPSVIMASASSLDP